MNRRLLLFSFSVIIIFAVTGCSKTIIIPPPPGPVSSPPPAPAKPPPAVKKTPAVASTKKQRKEKPYAVDGKWYFPVSSIAEFKEKGICSWYGPDFHGKSTSSGETYDQFGYTAAHRILPFNTQVRVKNPSNKKEILVRINDRGPFLKDRILDLSYTGAKELGLVGPGTALVELEALGILEEVEENGKTVTRLVQQVDFQKGDFSVQIGAFKDLQRALILKERLQKEYPQIEISETVRSGETFFRVRLAHCPELQEAIRLQKQLEGQGFSQALVVAD
ncbi:MAG: septal ring lytic transglycosylase RlpA family protein [Deltaproteobacteria bacterium]|nr:septal ring lytic transglycosylase RlpA family protein [Deltaproteobacteria bacterium]